MAETESQPQQQQSTDTQRPPNSAHEGAAPKLDRPPAKDEPRPFSDWASI